MATHAVTPRPVFAYLNVRPEQVPPIEDPRIKQLVQVALDTARASGADYADIRLTHQSRRLFVERPGGTWGSWDTESLTVGVRALMNGYWGFASSSIWSPDEMGRLGRSAANLARTNSLGKSRQVEMAPISVISDGHWTTPLKINPFEVPRDEVRDYFRSISRLIQRFPGMGPLPFNNADFYLTEKAFGSTDGSYATQRMFRSGMNASWLYGSPQTGLKISGDLNEYLSYATRGWEMFQDQPVQEHLRELYEELKEDASFPIKPVDVGRYDVVLDASTVAGLLGSSIGAATQLDRVMGYEANASGTSYINDPASMVGSFKIGSPLLTVVANRNASGGAATVRWDDEGVEPDVFTVIQGGVLSDFQTTRESAGWTKGWNISNGNSFRSHGCASAPEGLDAPLSHTPNLSIVPAINAVDMSSLVSGMENGLMVKRGRILMDFQQLNGYGGGAMYEVKKGKRVAFSLGAGILLRTPEFWKSVKAIGGERSARRYASRSDKGEPNQSEWSSIDAVPVFVNGLTIIDKMRKA